MNPDAYSRALALSPCYRIRPEISRPARRGAQMSKRFIQIQNGCNHACSYCITRLLRGRQTSFAYNDILDDARAAVADGFGEIVLTGVDIASYARADGDKVVMLSDLCKRLLDDVPGIRRLRLSSLDPASPQVQKIIALMKTDGRMMRHIHLSMQSGSDVILSAMRRRHTADMVRGLVRQNADVSFSWDIICGFPGETDELFAETAALARELRPIKIHAFPFSPRPGTDAAAMSNQIAQPVSKRRVREISAIADENKREFMRACLGETHQVLMEENNIGRTPDDIMVRVAGKPIPARSIRELQMNDISDLHFVA
jgi:threonylcarbamoyladenosine tRNA methylthiotransferase MtaB